MGSYFADGMTWLIEILVKHFRNKNTRQMTSAAPLKPDSRWKIELMPKSHKGSIHLYLILIVQYHMADKTLSILQIRQNTFQVILKPGEWMKD